MRINVLDTDTANKIAAGEVVERPFSVVKELLENSIDAESKNITVEILEGGQKSIKITDDGIGIHPDDVETAFLPHATSKINTINDIFKINTLGFRGEALASIASVSNTTLKSRTKDFSTGKEISITGGEINHLKDIGCNTGTIIEVKDLFYNVPARLKFLKSSQREAALISDIVNRLALANSNISFKLFSNDKKLITTYPSDNLSDTIRCVYGKSTYDNIISFEKHTDVCSVHGFIGNAEISRGSRNNQSIFVNNRYIKSKLITTAVENAFKSFLTINKFPFYVLFLDIFPEFIDVNIHPTKSEIKFKDDRDIFRIVFNSVHEALRKDVQKSFDYSLMDDSSDSLWEREIPKTEVVQIPIDFKAEEKYDLGFSREAQASAAIFNPFKSEESFIRDTETKVNYEEKIIAPARYDNVKPDIVNKIGDIVKENHIAKVEDEVKATDNLSIAAKVIERIPKFSKLSIIGQFTNTYILAEGVEGLYIIDQHAAHEKILFEKYKCIIKNQSIISQLLVMPVVLELSSEDFCIYMENESVFSKAGFIIEGFGENTVNIREVPIILGEPDVKNLFIDMINDLKSMGSGNTVDMKYDLIAKRACKAAIKANKSLSDMEMNALIEELRYIDEPFTCPHGRPTIIKITANELEKRFKRIQ